MNKYGSLKKKYKIIPLVIFGGLQFIQNIYKYLGNKAPLTNLIKYFENAKYLNLNLFVMSFESADCPKFFSIDNISA